MPLPSGLAPAPAMPPSGLSAEDYFKCVDALAEEYYYACGKDFDYLRKADGIFLRLCRQEGINVTAAIDKIHSQCNLFQKMTF